MEGSVGRFLQENPANDELVRPPLLHEKIVEHLRDLIFAGELMPGTRVSEKDPCARFGISRTPLREALKVLAPEGLITLLPNRGARVAQLTPEDTEELFPVMGPLEALSGELACVCATDTDIAEVKPLHYQMALHHTRGEREDYFRLNQNIHRKIMETAGNPTLASVYDALAGRIRYIANASQSRWDQAMVEHEAILAAFEARNGARLAVLLKSQLMNKLAEVKKAIEVGKMR